MPTDPNSLTWYAVGTKAKPAGTAGKLTPERRGVLASWIDDDAATTETPSVPATPTPAPPPVVTPPASGLPSRKRYGPVVWGTESAGGTFAEVEIVGTPAQAAADVHAVRVTAPKQNLIVRNVALRTCSNGLTIEHAPAILSARQRNWLVEDSLFADACGDPLYRGQGVYLAACDAVIFRRCWFVANGRAKDKRVGAGNTTVIASRGFAHGAYLQGGLTQWHMPEGCTRIRFEQCGFINNAAWGALCKADGCEVVDCFMAGNGYGMLLNGPLPCTATGNVVIAGGQACEWYGGQRAGAGGIQWRCASGTLADNLCVLPPENRMPVAAWRAPAFELANDANVKPNYHGLVGADGAGNYAFGWDADRASAGVAVPGLTAGPCPAADWAGFVADAERQARAGTANAKALIAAARRMAGVN